MPTDFLWRRGRFRWPPMGMWLVAIRSASTQSLKLAGIVMIPVGAMRGRTLTPAPAGPGFYYGLLRFYYPTTNKIYVFGGGGCSQRNQTIITPAFLRYRLPYVDGPERNHAGRAPASWAGGLQPGRRHDLHFEWLQHRPGDPAPKPNTWRYTNPATNTWDQTSLLAYIACSGWVRAMV